MRTSGSVEDGLPVGARLEGVEPAAALGPGHVGEAALGRLRGVLQAVGIELCSENLADSFARINVEFMGKI